ncbi:MAG: hypothetical protein KME31_21280 [Tolypothrix carrinoi HA7290-LM1]|jgi:hypothetical protein|nr:hypothetical protein [Tolypothrix carrinoi HA7290-LM1]
MILYNDLRKNYGKRTAEEAAKSRASRLGGFPDLGELALSGGFLRSPKGLPLAKPLRQEKASDLFKREDTEVESLRGFCAHSYL